MRLDLSLPEHRLRLSGHRAKNQVADSILRQILNNLADLESIYRTGYRAPVGASNLPSIGFGTPSGEGVGFFLHSQGRREMGRGSADLTLPSLMERGTSGVGESADVHRQTAHKNNTPAANEIGPKGTPDPLEDPSRYSAYQTDPTLITTLEDFNRADLFAGPDKVGNRSVSMGDKTIMPFVVELNNHGTLFKATWIGIVSGALRMGIQTDAPNLGFDLNTGFAARENTPSPLVVDTHNYSPDGINPELVIWRISSTAPISITGIAGGVEGEWHKLRNTGPFNISFPNESGLSSPSNRFTTGTGTTVVIGPDQTLDIWWDHIDQRWFADAAVYTAGGAATTKESHVQLFLAEPEMVC